MPLRATDDLEMAFEVVVSSETELMPLVLTRKKAPARLIPACPNPASCQARILDDRMNRTVRMSGRGIASVDRSDGAGGG